MTVFNRNRSGVLSVPASHFFLEKLSKVRTGSSGSNNNNMTINTVHCYVVFVDFVVIAVVIVSSIFTKDLVVASCRSQPGVILLDAVFACH